MASDTIKTLESLDYSCVETVIASLIGKENRKYYQKEAESGKLYKKLFRLKPMVWFLFKPIILHEERILRERDSGIIYAPNHRSTLDPIIIEAVLGENIHWAALSRFFDGTDSIFNNSKNAVLCKITSKVFKKLNFFPINRRIDTEKANNFDAIKDMLGFLRINSKIGIFGEGTTRRQESVDFNKFDDSFLRIAKKSGSWIQPIAILWLNRKKTKNQVIINIGSAFKVGDMDIEVAMEHFMRIQRNLLNESMCIKIKLEKQ